MCNKLVELIALGPELRVAAERRGAGVTEAYFLGHEILAATLRDPDRVPTDGARDHLAAQLERRLGERHPTFA